MEGKTSSYDLLLVGRYFCDLVFTKLPEFPRLGYEVYSKEFHLVPGGVYTPAVTLTRLGLKIIWPCKFGSDTFSQFVKSEAQKAGVDDAFFTQSSKPSLRITVAFSFENERAFLSYIDPLPEIPYVEIILKTCPKWVYLTHLLIGEVQKEIVNAAREVGAKTFMDCQAHDTTINDPATKEALSCVDVFSPNREEALVLTGDDDIENALKKLAGLTPTVVIKDGENGCIYTQSGKVIRSPGIKVDVVDTTGAGDNFNCGFIYGQLNGYSLEDTLRIANICGGLSTTGIGGSNIMVDEEILSKYL
ncbi:MAG TPA: sugar kinase [Pelolinea sp.]|nr:sugar kinase [Pelolinea sp.]